MTRGERSETWTQKWGGPCGVCAGSSMITGTGSEPGRSFHICSGLFDRDRLFRCWTGWRSCYILCPGSGPCLQPQAQCLQRRLAGAGCLAPCSLTHRMFIQTFPQKVEQHTVFCGQCWKYEQWFSQVNSLGRFIQALALRSKKNRRRSRVNGTSLHRTLLSS